MFDRIPEQIPRLTQPLSYAQKFAEASQIIQNTFGQSPDDLRKDPQVQSALLTFAEGIRIPGDDIQAKGALLNNVKILYGSMTALERANALSGLMEKKDITIPELDLAMTIATLPLSEGDESDKEFIGIYTEAIRRKREDTMIKDKNGVQPKKQDKVSDLEGVAETQDANGSRITDADKTNLDFESLGNEAHSLLERRFLPDEYRQLKINGVIYDVGGLKMDGLDYDKLQQASRSERYALIQQHLNSEGDQTLVLFAQEKESGQARVIIVQSSLGFIHNEQLSILRSIHDWPYLYDEGLRPDKIKDLLRRDAVGYIHLLQTLRDQGKSNLAPKLYDYGKVDTRNRLMVFSPYSKPSTIDEELSNSAPTADYMVMEMIGSGDGFKRDESETASTTGINRRKIVSSLAQIGYAAPKPEVFVNDKGEVKTLDLAGSVPITEVAVRDTLKFLGDYYGLPSDLVEGSKVEGRISEYASEFYKLAKESGWLDSL